MLLAQTSSDAGDLEQLKSVVGDQQQLLEQQQAQIQALQLAPRQQKQILAGIVQQRTEGAKQLPAVTETNTDEHLSVEMRTQTPESQAVPAGQQPSPLEQEQVEEELQRGPEIADVTPTTPALQLGPAKIRLMGCPRPDHGVAIDQQWRQRGYQLQQYTVQQHGVRHQQPAYLRRTRAWQSASMPT